ncbi:MAG: protein kinase domain-containing protein [Gammaproteobacteria bacterium]
MQLRILIIDDHRDFRAWLGHHVTAAQPEATVVGHDPAADRALPAGFDPAAWDLVFLDHRPGAHDGFALLAELKSHPECPPIVLLTPQGDQDAIVRALQAGADDYLAKDASSHEHIARVVREAVRRGRPAAPRAPSAPEQDSASSFRLKGYRPLKQLGSRSAVSVHLLEHERDARLVVTKVFRQAPGQPDQVAPLQRFLREYEIVSGIRHPNVVRIFDLGIDDEGAFIIMEYFAGGHLGERIADGLSMSQALERIGQIALALDAIHSVGILHRDLKPANIMLRDDGSLALIDFGVAKLRDQPSELTGLGEIFGTPYYMSPEQGEGLPADERSDLYSLGVVLHELLTGCKPYVAGSPIAILWKHCHAPLPVLPAPFQPCQALLNRLMAKSVDDRPPSARAVLETVESLRAELGGAATALAQVRP